MFPVVRKKSLQENIKFAKSVILPSESSQSQDEKARKNRRIIQVASQVSTERRRSSLLDQVKFARSVINQVSFFITIAIHSFGKLGKFPGR